MRITAVVFASLLAAPAVSAQPAALPPGPEGHGDPLRPALVQRFETLAGALDGAMSYCVIDLTSGERIERRGDAAFPTASTIKIAILYELFAQAQEGRIRLDEVRPIDAATRVAGSGILQYLDAPALTLADYATLMIMLSDNSATNVLIDAVGMDAVNRRMRGLGLERIWLQRRMIDLDAARQGRENLASACDLARLLQAIQAGTGLTPQARDAMLAILRKPKDTAFTRAVPEGVPIASKPGGLEGVAVDAAYVALPGRPYVMVGMTSWLARAADGEAALEAFARAAHGYFLRVARGGRYGRLIE